MADKNLRYQELSRKRLENSITEAEADELAAWLNEEDGADLQVPVEMEAQIASHEARMMDIIKGVPKVVGSPGRRRPMFSIRAVAALLLLFLGVAILYRYLSVPDKSDNSSKKLVHVKDTMQDLQPGHNTAVLTLANGRKINLDNAANGTLAKQGIAEVHKSANGLLSYSAMATHQHLTAVLNTLSTPKGGQYQLALPDGTKAWLNAASSISYPVAFVGNNRDVTITGEVYFEVAKDKSRPFHVKVGNAEITVLGTHFNVNAYKDESSVKTTLLEGAVVFKSPTGAITLKPGQQAQENNAGGLVLKTGIDLEETVAWKNGKFEFGNKSDIYSIMRQISRWYNVDIEYQGTIDTHIGGSISRNVTASQVFKMLEATGSVHFKIENKKIIVMP